jgi:hypothetical protein
VRLISYIIWYKSFSKEYYAEWAIEDIFEITDAKFNWQMKQIGKSKWIIYAEVGNE